MTVLFVHEGYISEHNGEYYSAPYNNDIVSRYKTLGEQVTFLTRKETYQESNKKYNKIDIEGFSFIGVENFKSLKGMFKYLEIREIIKQAVKDSDYIVARIPGDLGNLAIKFARKYNKKYVIELVGCPWDALWNYGVKGKLLAPYLYLITKRIIKNAPFVIYVSSQFLQKRYPTNGEYTNCSNVSLIENNTDILTKRLINNNNLYQKPKIIVGTAAVIDVAYKGQQYVIKAISNLNKQGYNIEYQLVGSGDIAYLSSIAREYNVEDRIVFIGSMPHKEVFKWLDNINIYIQPSLTEGLPRALIEAMSRGCICIGSDAGGIPELLPLENIFKKGYVESIEEVLKKAIDNGVLTIQTTFETSGTYSKEIIEKRREDFLLKFKNYNENG